MRHDSTTMIEIKSFREEDPRRRLSQSLSLLAEEAVLMNLPRTALALRTALVACGVETQGNDLLLGRMWENVIAH